MIVSWKKKQQSLTFKKLEPEVTVNFPLVMTHMKLFFTLTFTSFMPIPFILYQEKLVIV